MPVLDGNFEAFVTNLGKYNEGALVGEWVKFPTTEEEIKVVFTKLFKPHSNAKSLSRCPVGCRLRLFFCVFFVNIRHISNANP